MINLPKETWCMIENPKHQLKWESENLSNCQMWIMCPQPHTLLKVSLSCTISKTTKLSSRWSSKDEVQQWDKVSRTHRVALDWLFDRIHLEPKIHIKYVDTKNQLADMLTKESFSRDEWNHLLRLFNIMNFSMYLQPLAIFFVIRSESSDTSKRGQDATSQWRFTNGKAKTNSFSEGETNQLGLAQPVDVREKILHSTWDSQSIWWTTIKYKEI